MVTVVFHWGVHPEHNREFQDTLDEVMNWFKSQPGFLMGVVGRDSYNYNEMLSCLEWQSKENADKAYAQWEGTPWFSRLQSFLSRPTSFVTYDNVGTFMPKGTSLPWSAGERPAKPIAREIGMTKTTPAAGMRERQTRAAATVPFGKTKTQGPKRETAPRPSERAMGAESRAPRGKMGAETKTALAKMSAESRVPRGKMGAETKTTRGRMSAESRVPQGKRQAKS